MLQDPGKDGKIKNTLSFRGRGLKTYPLFMFRKKTFVIHKLNSV
jgi:hypothetical protein